MDCPIDLPPQESGIIKPANSNLSKKQKKRKRKNKQKKLRQLALKDLKKKDVKFNHTMSTWAESFTQAATWQLRHQLAYWKAKATALDYENKVLREIIEKKYHESPTSLCVGPRPVSDSDQSMCSSDEENINYDVIDNVVDDDVDKTGSDLEASEELIQFLAANSKYKEDARRERERLKAKYDHVDVAEVVVTPQEATDNKLESLKQLYGEKWQAISALETSVQLNFMSECDKSEPTYWPNIPFNFNFK